MVAVGQACRVGRYYPINTHIKKGKPLFTHAEFYKQIFLYILERISYRFASNGPTRILAKPGGLKIAYKAVLVQMGIYIPSVPVEEKGYKRMINLPDWLNM